MSARIIISACLAGIHTRYDGGACPHRSLDALARRGVIVPVCPEILGGMGIPRSRCRFLGGDGKSVLEGNARVIDRTGVDRTDLFLRGARETLRIMELISAEVVVFKEGSPSCGVHRIDLEGTRQEGCGVTTALLVNRGFRVVSENESWE